MRIDRKKFELAKARACMGTKEIIEKGIPRGTLCRVLSTGSVRPETAGKIAKALNIDVTEILENEKE